MSLVDVLRKKSTEELAEILPKARKSSDAMLVYRIKQELERRTTQSTDGESK